MISVCIPLHNYYINDFVMEIVKQCEKCNIIFEINIFDDKSDELFAIENRELGQNKFINYRYSNVNVGRAAARNKLAQTAIYDNILFIDCDSMPLKNSYIQDYLSITEFDVVCGGTAYIPEQKIRGSELRYKYGVKKEAVPANIRNKRPNRSFTTNNLLIKKSIIRKVKFNESITKYGHEDTLLGYDLDKAGYIIKHIENPVIHLGVETNDVFLAKTKQSIQNLVDIENNKDIDSSFLRFVKLVRIYKLAKKIGLSLLFRLFGSNAIAKMESRLVKSDNPSLLMFDFYKLLYYSGLAAKK